MAPSRILPGRSQINRIQPTQCPSSGAITSLHNTLSPTVPNGCRVHRYCSEQIKHFKTKADMFFLWACGAFVIFVGAVILAVRFASEELKQVNALGMTIYVLGLVSITVGAILIVCGIIGLVKRRMKLKKLYGNSENGSTHCIGRTNSEFSMDIQNEAFCVDANQRSSWVPYGGTSMPMVLGSDTQQFFSVMVQSMEGTTPLPGLNSSTMNVPSAPPPPYSQISLTFPYDKPPDYEDIRVQTRSSHNEIEQHSFGAESARESDLSVAMETPSDVTSPNTSAVQVNQPVDVIPMESCSNAQTVPDVVARF